MHNAHELETATPGFSVLILEDDPVCAKTLELMIQHEGGEACTCPSIAAAEAAVKQQHFDLYLLDHRLPDGLGSQFYHALRAKGRLGPAIMLTAYPEIPLAVELTRHGIFDYLTKPFEPEELISRLRQAIPGLHPPEPEAGQQTLVGRSPLIREVLYLILQAAASPATTVLLTGETGTGKDLAAWLIHQHTFQGMSPQPAYICLNCPTLPSEMFEAELFGAEKGSYTGAHQRRRGLVDAAEGGTLFLDEIADVPFHSQGKLLQFLETRVYRRLGSTEARHFHGRVVAATNRVLQEEVKRGHFRSDLLYRLDVFPIHLPPLREHMEDLGCLAETLCDQLTQKYHRQKLLLAPQDLALLEGYDFPGNVRELRNLLERSLLRTPADASWLQIDPMWLAQIGAGTKPQPSAPAAAATAAPAPAGAAPAPAGEQPLARYGAVEYELIREALVAEKGVIRRAAARLGLSHQTLLRRLERWPDLQRLRSPQKPRGKRPEASLASSPDALL
jgi:DNA-binding NtrC family response regulator